MIIKNKEILFEEWHSFLNTKLYMGIISVKDINTQEIKTLVGICENGNREQNIKSIIEFGSKTQLKGG